MYAKDAIVNPKIIHRVCNSGAQPDGKRGGPHPPQPASRPKRKIYGDTRRHNRPGCSALVDKPRPCMMVEATDDIVAAVI